MAARRQGVKQLHPRPAARPLVKSVHHCQLAQPIPHGYTGPSVRKLTGYHNTGPLTQCQTPALVMNANASPANVRRLGCCPRLPRNTSFAQPGCIRPTVTASESLVGTGCSPRLWVHGAEGRVVQAPFDRILQVVEDDGADNLLDANFPNLMWHDRAEKQRRGQGVSSAAGSRQHWRRRRRSCRRLPATSGTLNVHSVYSTRLLYMPQPPESRMQLPAWRTPPHR